MENCKGRRRKRDRASSPSNKTVTTEQIASHNFPKVAKTEAKELPAEKSSTGLLLDGENSGPLTLDLQKFVHARVVKKTNGELRFGVVESYCRQKDENPIKEAADASWLFSVQYDDGSKETLSTSDLQESLQLCQKSDAFKGKYISDGPQCLAVPLANEIPPSRVAKYFGDDLYFGDLSSRNSHGFYEVRYDDGDSEEWDGSEVSLGIALCNEHVENHTRDLWAIYDLDAKQMKKRWSLASKAAQNCWPRSFVTNAPTVVKFYLFVMERQRSWIRRKTQRMQHPERWTNDRVFRDYYFCNVYRQLDRGTAYFRSQILDLWSESSPEDLDILRGEWFVRVLWASYCYRLVNKIESFQKDPDSHDPIPTTKFDGIPTIQQWPKFKALVKRAKDDGKVLFTSAHQTCGFDRYTEQLDIVHGEQTRLQYVAAQSESLESCLLAISKQLPGCGPFLAWQILCDLVESNCLDEVPDVDFCVLGKGAKAGILEIFYPSRTKVSLNSKEYLELTKLLVEHQESAFAHLKDQEFRTDFPYWQNQRLTTKEIEHSLCEFSKYQRIERALQGKQKSTGQRLRKSRSHLDKKHYDHTCGACKAASPTELTLCDTCNRGYCTNCDPTERDPISWVCRRCNDLNNHSWA